MDDQANVVGARPSAAERPQESGAAALGRGGRMSRQRKTAAVLRLLRETYNTTWLIERHGFLTLAQFRQKQLQTAAVAA